MVHYGHKILLKLDVSFVNFTKIYTNRRVFLCNAILVTEIFWYQYSITNNPADLIIIFLNKTW